MATICRILKNGDKRCWETPGNFQGGKTERKCQYCGKIFYVFPCVIKVGKGKFCSQSCVAKTTRNAKGKTWKMPEGFDNGAKERWLGENNPNWAGGKRKTYIHYRNADYKNWREKVFERDNYICQICGRKGCYLHPHHLKSYTKYPLLRYVIDNGLTLCVNCHHIVHARIY